ncbi:MAG TPA: DNA translocase FtsK [Planctomycetota bacterium]|nr:DNA translocase FtsK [Planctomycetota bacterium]
MNAGNRPHPAAPRAPLVVPWLLFLASITTLVFVFLGFRRGETAGVARALGVPLTLAAAAAAAVMSAWWVAVARAPRRPLQLLIASALVALPAAGLLTLIQGASADDVTWGGFAGRRLAEFTTVRLGWGAAAGFVAYGAAFLFALYFIHKTLGLGAPADEDPAIVLARLQQARRPAAVAEVPPPAVDEGLGLPNPIGAGERDLFGADAELAPTPDGTSIDDAAREDEEATFVPALEDEEPPPPPRRRRVLENLVDEEAPAPVGASAPEPVGWVRAASATAPAAVAATHGAERAPEPFGVGVIDVEDDEDLYAAPPTASVAEASVAASATVDERESLDDAVESVDDAPPREEERPLFAPPPRTLPFDDDDSEPESPAGDEPSDRLTTAPASSEALAAAIEAPPPPRFEPHAVGGRTGEPFRALADDAEVAETEEVVDDETPSETAQGGLFADVDVEDSSKVAEDATASVDAAEAADAETPPRRRRRASKPRRAVEPDAAAAAPLAEDAFGARTEPDDETSDAAVADVPAQDATEVEAETVEPGAVDTPPPPTREPRATPRARTATPPAAASATASKSAAGDADDFETLVRRAAETVVADQRCSPSLLQRELGIRFVEAAAVIEKLHARGVVGPHTPSGVREVLVGGAGAGG